MRYSVTDIEKLLSHLKIEEVVGEFVDLKKSGANFKGICPFHADTNPSFMVNPRKNICKCFVCGVGGNPITFYSKYNKISYSASIKELSEKYKINIKPISNNPELDILYEKYYKIMEDAHTFFKNNIFTNDGRKALEYLSSRKISPDIIKKFGLGYALDKWGNLYEFLIQKGYDLKDIETLGLVKQSEKGIFDFYRDRIIFPIYSSGNRIIGFGGRAIEDRPDNPKYINSPETLIFKKGKNLYGFERINKIKERNYAMLMEGYMDVLRANIYGFDTAVAPLGTALTEEQSKILKKYTSNILLCFDGDNAGQMATEKAINTLTKLKFLSIRVIEIEKAKDPDEFLNNYGREEFLKLIKKSKTAFDFLYEYYSKDIDFNNIIGKDTFIKKFMEYFSYLDNPLLKANYIDKLAMSLSVDKNVLQNILIVNNNFVKKDYIDNYTILEQKQNQKESICDKLESMTINFILLNPKKYSFFVDFDINGLIKSEFTKKIFELIKNDEQEFYSLHYNEIIKKVAQNLSLTDVEKQTFENICINYDVREENLIDLLKGWISRHIKNEKLKIKDADSKKYIALLKNNLKFENNLDNVINMYKDFTQKIVYKS